MNFVLVLSVNPHPQYCKLVGRAYQFKITSTKIYERITNVIAFVCKIPWLNADRPIFATIPVFPATLILEFIASLVWISGFPTGV